MMGVRVATLCVSLFASGSLHAQSIDLDFHCGAATAAGVTSVGDAADYRCSISYANTAGYTLGNVSLALTVDPLVQSFDLAPALPQGVPLLTTSSGQTWRLITWVNRSPGDPFPTFDYADQVVTLTVGEVPDQTIGEASFFLGTTLVLPAGDLVATISANVDGVPDRSIQHTFGWNGGANVVRLATLAVAQADRNHVGSIYVETPVRGNAHTGFSMRVYLPYWDGGTFRTDDQFDAASGHVPIIPEDEIAARLALVNMTGAPVYAQDLPAGSPVDGGGRRSAPTSGDNANVVLWYDPADNTLRANPGVWWSSESLVSGLGGHGLWRLRWEGPFHPSLPVAALSPGGALPVEGCVESRETGAVVLGDSEYCATGTTTITVDEELTLDTVHILCPGSSSLLAACHTETAAYAPGSTGRTELALRNTTSLTGTGTLLAQLPGAPMVGKLATLTRIAAGPGLVAPASNESGGNVAAAELHMFVSPAVDYTGSPISDDVTTRDLPAAGTIWEECTVVFGGPGSGVECDLSGLTTAAADIGQVRVDLPGMKPHTISLADSTQFDAWFVELSWTVDAGASASIDGTSHDTDTTHSAFGVKSSFALVAPSATETVTDAQTGEITGATLATACAVAPTPSGNLVQPICYDGAPQYFNTTPMAPLEVVGELDTPAAFHGRKLQMEITDQAGDDIAPDLVIAAQFETAEYRQFARIDPGVVLIQGTEVLRIGRADHADRGNTEADQVAMRMGGVTLEVAVKGAFALRDCQFVVGSGEVIHADIDIAGRIQLLAAHAQNIELFPGRRQLPGIDPPLRFKALWQVGIVKD